MIPQTRKRKEIETADKTIKCPDCHHEDALQCVSARPLICKNCETCFCGHCGQKKTGHQKHVHANLTCQGARAQQLGSAGDITGFYYCPDCNDFFKTALCKHCNAKLTPAPIEGTFLMPICYPKLNLSSGTHLAQLFSKPNKRADFLQFKSQNDHFFLQLPKYLFQIPAQDPKIYKVKLCPFPGTFIRIPKNLNIKVDVYNSSQLISFGEPVDLGPKPIQHRRLYVYFLFQDINRQNVAVSNAIPLAIRSKSLKNNPQLSLLNRTKVGVETNGKNGESGNEEEEDGEEIDYEGEDDEGEDCSVSSKTTTTASDLISMEDFLLLRQHTFPFLGVHFSAIHLPNVLEFLRLTNIGFVYSFMDKMKPGQFEANLQTFGHLLEEWTKKMTPLTELNRAHEDWAKVLEYYDRYLTNSGELYPIRLFSAKESFSKLFSVESKF
jgi:hypothetical protein